MRAINSGSAISCDYTSLSSGTTTRMLVPHALANNGQRWHVRAFDSKSNEFRDFACTRLQNVKESSIKVEDKAALAQDSAWNTFHHITLVPHPSIKHPKAIELDYAMVAGKLELSVREALIGYLLRQWNVDCTVEGTLEGTLVGGQYQLRLDNIHQLQRIESLSIAPGYKT